MQVELVLTAHPTEAKRTIVLEHHRSLYLLLVKRENQVWTPNEQRAIREEFKTLLSLLWRTGEIFLHKPDVAAERRNVMHYLYTVFPDVLPALDGRLRESWAHWDSITELLRAPGAAAAMPSGHLGGRRSGRPSAGDARRSRGETLEDLRLHGLLLLQRQLVALGRQASLSDRLEPPPPALSGRVGALDALAGRAAADADAPASTARPGGSLSASCWRSCRSKACTPRADGCDMAPDGYQRAAELIADLRLLHESLVAVGAWRVADAAVAPVIRAAQTFGFHLASLDIRQNSALLRPRDRRNCSRRPGSSSPTIRAGPKNAGSSSSIASSRRRGRFSARTCRRVLKPTRCWGRSACWPIICATTVWTAWARSSSA